MSDTTTDVKFVEFQPQFAVWLTGKRARVEAVVQAINGLSGVEECEYLDDDGETHLIKIRMRVDSHHRLDELVEMYDYLLFQASL
ncbi:MAG TPA: hypothetical protein PLN95_02855 [Candidatus Saccharibacteria bacterium]|nr:hypothetical protein [Candidatus Saccharibacteria bacterium]